MQYKELTVQEIAERFSISNTSAYRKARSQSWEYVSIPLERGGRKKLYRVPVDEIPKVDVTELTTNIPEAARMGVVHYDDTIPNLTPDVVIPEHELYRAQLKAALCEKILSEINYQEVKKTALKDVAEAYNRGYLIPELFKMDGKRTVRTLRIWLKTYEESGKDFKSLVRLSKATSKMKATEIEQNFLLNLLLDANKIKIGSAIRKLKQLSRLDAIESPTSERALRRWVESWRDSHIQEWNLLRMGKKYIKDKGIFSISRAECLEVGDVWVADGHKLAFDIIDPISGKPKRMMLILFFDWGSRYPVGASIANTEDSEHIMMALRNGIMNWGATPKFVYLDNGKAFRAKLFHEKWESHDLSKEFNGIFPRLGIEVEFAKAYNARAKVVERFFRTFQEDFERYMDSFRGASIADKPAFLMRNEKWIKSLKKREPLTLDKAQKLISSYMKHFYGKTPHGGLSGKTPLEVFESAEIPQERKIEVSKLNFLMLKVEERSIRADGIQLANIVYYHDELMRRVGKKVYLRYDLMDMRSVLVYGKNEKLICQAMARKSTHPFVKLSKDKPVTRKQWQKQLAHQRKLEKDLKRNSSIIRQQVEQETSEIVMAIAELDDAMFSSTPLLENNPKTEPDLDDLIQSQLEDFEKYPLTEKTLTEEERGIQALDKLFENLGL